MPATETVKLSAADGAASDNFGISVAAGDDLIVVGAYGDESYRGAAYIFARNQGGADAWGQVKKLTASDGTSGDRFGECVRISNDVIVVGASGNASSQGAAYVFSRNQGGADAWGQVKKLTASDGAASDYFGLTVSIDDSVVVVGAFGDASLTGAAYVFARNQGGADTWGQVKKLTASDGAASDRFGASVSVSTDTVIVGAPFVSSSKGTVYVFARNQGGADNWGELKKLTASDGAASNRFGIAVSIDGDIIAVGADTKNAAYVFERNQGGADTWGQVKKLTASDSVSWENFGYSVSACGDSVAVGADGTASNTGAVYIYSRDQGGEDTWGQAQKLTASDGAQLDYFGTSVSLSAASLAAGARGVSSNKGAAYVFTTYDSAISTTTTLVSTTTTVLPATTTTAPASTTTTVEPGCCVDNDEDGYGIGPGCTGEQDCNDADPDMHPAAEEICGDGIDNNCSGEADENCDDKKCLAQKLLGQDSPGLAHLRSFRDETLAATAVGRKIISLYYRHGGSIEAALDRSPALRSLARGMLEAVAPMLGSKK